MANDPAFLFYPGDYLRDTQCLSERSQVAYDRIMCEHMRNICITQAQLDFFTKRLTSDEKSELMMVLTPAPGGFCIQWVVESIVKRREYSDSRRKNRSSKDKEGKKDMSNISKTYVPHMEIENEIVIENDNVIKGVQGENKFTEDFFTQVFDSRTMGDYKLAFPQHDLSNEMVIFKMRIRSDPGKYIHRETGGIRQAFTYQLKNSRNGNGHNTKTSIRRADATIENGREFGEL